MAAKNDANVLPRAPPPRRPPARLPVSGSEDVFADVTYGAPRGRGNNNCYAWAIGDYRNRGGHKLQPGNLARVPRRDEQPTTCAAISAAAAADLKGRSYRVDPERECRRGYYKIMAFVDANGSDYHWYKQHRDLLITWPADGRWKTVADAAKALDVPAAAVYSPRMPPQPGDMLIVKDARLWSHKRGFATGPLLQDACGRAIRDPRKACRKYANSTGEALDYSSFCGAMCVKPASRRAARR